MDKRINGLKACHAVRKEGQANLNGRAQGQSDSQNIDTTDPWSDTPLEDLLSQAPAAPYASTFHTTTNTYNPAFSQPPLLEHDILREASNQYPRQLPQLGRLKLFPATSRSVKAPSVGQSALSTHISTSSIQRRLPQYSVRYLKKIVRLLDHSVFEASAAATTVAHSVSTRQSQGDPSTSESATITANDGENALSTESMFPGIFLVLDRCMKDQGLCIPGLKPHDNKSCWCAVLEELGAQQTEFWSLDFMGDHFDVNLRDEFDNTALHLLAARGASWSLIIDLIDMGADINAKNVAGQNFLHVWNCRSVDIAYFSTVGILERLANLNFEFNHCDFFGRTFFHALSGLNLSPIMHAHLISSIRIGGGSYAASTRDAFGSIPRPRISQVTTGDVMQLSGLLSIPEAEVSSIGDSHESAVSRFGRNLAVPLNSSPSFSQRRSDFETKMYQSGRSSTIQHDPTISEDFLHPSAPLVPFQESHAKDMESSISSRVLKSPWTSLKPVSGRKVKFESTSLSSTSKTMFKDDYFWKHARFIETARLALDAPWIEEPEGRNGLQCVAEAVLDIHVEDGKVVSSKACKRKRSQPENLVLSLRLHLRYELVKSLVSCGANVNNYDSSGSTVLMAFVTHLPDGEDDKTISKILEHLLRNGANLHWRNREGETALYIAVCLGRKVATRVLLDHGANVHARTADGTGILLAAEYHYLKARDNPQLYASIWACMARIIGYGAKPSPTLVQEWSFHKTNSP